MATLDGETINVGDTVYYRQTNQYGTVTQITGATIRGRFDRIGDVFFDQNGLVHGVKQVGWGAPIEFWKSRTDTQEQMTKLKAVMESAINLMGAE